ncbi:hypothetical protein Ancab_005369 [Ancistrocladus abbreviatus]
MAAQLYLCCVLFIFYVLQSSPTVAAAEVEVANSIRSINFGVIINEDTRVGKEHKVAMKIAVQNFNDRSKNFNLSLHFRNSNGHAFQAASAAVELTGENEIKAIIGMEKWQEAALVAQIGSQYQLPILFLATAPATLPSAPQRWPSLVQKAGNYSHQITCIADIVKYYNWRKVIAVYEDDGYAGTSVMLDIVNFLWLP